MCAQSARFFVPFFVWLCLGSLGLIALAFNQDVNALRALGVLPDMPDNVVRLLIVVQPFILLVAGIGAGVAFGDRVELRSWVTARLRGDPPPLMQLSGLALAALVGFGTGAVVVVLDRVFAPWIGLPSVASLPDIGTALMAISYGGITEELMLRYGLMTLLVWVGARVWTTLPPGLYFGALLVSAVLFGAGHLPAMAALIPLTPVVILRTVGLNALLGLAFGWLFWRRGLEHAMVAHIATHVAFWALAFAL
ncbi:CAAX amino terminal protease self-immunity [Thalassovita gelatinovora]|uniref:CAAX amino terminal protease self-immunity n=1 Tax=Thalassovita gelatinovora TaxID=53501 RepID=A0A0N7LUK6_THAGE|nr:CPBP family glutamic-type intramembrane protease [Thalassovita gelatinovora]QIZ82238.1 CPBP family intramembrane metalloprotease [Thalassovita gelatinovora]CUH63762.1 CAAX amino terminal protease self-immunity [Thalassovita gelatinovora]SEQ98072.1 CAAX protease self-immunity [Thalassovita gelatinovora]